MKKLMTYLFCLVLGSQLTIVAQCSIMAGLAEAPVFEILADGSNLESLAITDFVVTASGADRIEYLVIGSEVDSSGSPIIIGVADETGVFDFSDDGTGNPYPVGEYCFVQVAYDEEDFNNFGNMMNPLLPIVTPSAFFPPYSIRKFVLMLESAIPPVSLASFEEMIHVTIPSLGIPVFCHDIADEGHCVELVLWATNIAENQRITNIAHFPNPVTNSVTFSFATTQPEALTLQIYDLSGKLFLEENRMATTGQQQWTVDIAQFSTGMYFYQLGNGEDWERGKVFKK